MKHKAVTPKGDDVFAVNFSYSFASSGAYLTRLKVGTGIETDVTAILDTGSAETWIDISTGFTQVSKSFRGTLKKSFKQTYISGSVSGFLGKDSIRAECFRWTQDLAVVTEFGFEKGDIQGLIGLSRGGCDSRQLCSLENWTLKHSVFSFYYDPYTWQGVFIAGDIFEEQYCAPGTRLTYLSLKPDADYFWQAYVGMKFNDILLGDKLDAVFDTGTTYLVMSQTLYDSIQAIVTARGCSSPELILIVNGQELAIPREVLMTGVGCEMRLGVLASGSAGHDLLVGATFLVNFYSVFDLTDDRIGFCPATGSGAASRRLEDFDGAAMISRLLDDKARIMR